MQFGHVLKNFIRDSFFLTPEYAECMIVLNFLNAPRTNRKPDEKFTISISEKKIGVTNQSKKWLVTVT